jgi:hypothetical protein
MQCACKIKNPAEICGEKISNNRIDFLFIENYPEEQENIYFLWIKH